MTTPLPLHQIVLAGPRASAPGWTAPSTSSSSAIQVCPPPVYVRKEIVH